MLEGVVAHVPAKHEGKTNSDLKRISRQREIERVDLLHIVEGVHPSKIWQSSRQHIMSQIPVMKVQTSEITRLTVA